VKRSLKILRVIARLNVGGPARHVILLDGGLTRRGHETLLIHGAVDAGEASLEHLTKESSIPIEKIPHLGRRISVLSDLRAFARLTSTIFRISPDVVHTHTAKAGTLGRLAVLLFNATRRRDRRCLVVHTFHGHVLHGYFHPFVNVLVRFAERTLALATDRIVTISPAQKTEITRRFRIAPETKTVVIPLGLDLGALLEMPATAESYRRELSIGTGDVVVGFVGRMVPVKDVSTLVRAFAAAWARAGDLWLLLAGGGPLRSALEAEVERAGISGRVRFVGWTEDLVRVYSTIDILALSSLNEGTPVAVIEAMAAGKPVAATAVGGVPDVVSDGSTGLLVPPRDVDALAAALLQLANAPALRHRMGQAARQLVRGRFSHKRLVDDVERLYVSGLDAKRGPSR
jgi:glycosyltransferase involved in cell wall biosynthesis